MATLNIGFGASEMNKGGKSANGLRTGEGVKGRKARLLEEVAFHTTYNLLEQNKTRFKAGTIITGVYKMTNTDLFIFEFGGRHQFPIRPSKFEWVN